jgi:thioredoxin 1
MKTISELTETNFDRAIAGLNGPAVVDVYAPWCGPCKMIAPLLEKLAEHFAGRIEFFKVNVDGAPALAERFGITGVPTLLFFSNGELRDTMVGFASLRDLVARLETLAANAKEARA